MAIRTTPNAILKKLEKIAPDIDFVVNWEEDAHFVWDGDGPDPRDEGYIPHDVDVIARVVLGGEEKKGTQSLGGVYDKPGEEAPDIHGYLPQMLDEAITDLVENGIVAGPREWTPRQDVREIVRQAKAAGEYLDEVMHVRYEAQMRRRRKR